MGVQNVTNSSKTTKSALIIIIFTLGSKLLGFVREVLIAAKFGSGMETDTFFISLTATGLLVGFLSNAISTTFIPILSEIESKEGKKGKIKHSNNMLNVIFTLSIFLTIIGWFVAPTIVKLLARGFYGEQFELAVQLTRLGLPMILFGGIIGVLTGYLQSEQKFASTAAIGVPFNLIYIFYLLFLSSRFGIKGLMIAGVLAVASQFLIQLPESITLGYNYEFHFNLNDKYIRKVITLSMPVLVGVAINDLNSIVDRTLASNLIPGSISALNYASRLNNLVLGVFISAVTTVIFPLLSKEANNSNMYGMKKIMDTGISLILIITVPATIGLMVLSSPIVEIAFQRGEFDSLATLMTSQSLIFYSLGLVAMSLRLLLIRVFYSIQDTKTPMINGAISVGFNIIFNIILVNFMNHNGLALGTSLATTFSTILLFFVLKNRIGSLNIKLYINTFLKTGLASIALGVVSYVIYHKLYTMLGGSTLYNLIALLVAMLIGAIIYIVICYFLGVAEIRDNISNIKKRLVR